MNRSRLALSACVLLAAAGSALAQSGGADAPKPRQTLRSVEEAPTLKVGDAAPALSVAKWVKGEPVTGFQKGKPYVVEFWATWCGPCIASMPHLSELQKEYGPKGLTIIGVSTEDERNSLGNVEEMVAKKGDGMAYTVAWDKGHETNDAYMKAAKRNGIPCSFVVDQQGKIAYIGHPQTLDFVLDKVMGGSWDAEKGPAEVKAFFTERGEVFKATQDDPAEAVKKLDAFTTKYSSPALAAMTQDMRFRVMSLAGRPADAKAAGMALVEKRVAAKDAQGLNEIAWFLVDPEGEVKKPELDVAMRAASEAARLSENKDAAILDTLARAHFLKGEVAKAVEVQRRAVELAPKQLKEDLEKSLKEYEAANKS
jgi:thiol-disulfide isomerase/thioredoxin